LSQLLETGSVLAGRYVIERVLGQGGMGAVYLASDSHIPEKQWAIKELWDYGDPATRKLIQDQFKRESSILATLDHYNLPRITDFSVYNNREYLVMDYIEGETLEEKIKKSGHPLDINFAMSALKQLIDVLEYLHGQDPPVIFRDLKPANIMITPDDKVKLIDFGIARIFQSGKQKDTVVMGTPGYASPEQYGTSQSDVRSDIYGLGATIYYVLTGLDPADNPFHFDSPSKHNPKIPPRLENSILKCVQMDPDNRFANVGEIKTYLFDRQAMQTADLVPDLAGARIELPPQEAVPRISTVPEKLNFGVVKRGANRRLALKINGKVSRLSIVADQPWVRVYPTLLNGIDPAVGVTVYSRSLNHGGKYNGLIKLKGHNVDISVPISVEIETKHLNFLTYLAAFIFMLLSFFPILGYLGFILNMIVYLTVPKGERKSLKVLFIITISLTLLWTVVGALIYFGATYLGWFQ